MGYPEGLVSAVRAGPEWLARLSVVTVDGCDRNRCNRRRHHRATVAQIDDADLDVVPLIVCGASSISIGARPSAKLKIHMACRTAGLRRIARKISNVVGNPGAADWL